MADIREPWREVANRAEALGLKLRLHLEQEEGTAREAAETVADSTADTVTDSTADTVADSGPSGAAAEGTPPPPPGAAGTTRAAIDDLGNKLKDAFESFGAAARDPAVRSDVTDIGVLLKDALVATFTSVGADVTEVVKDVTEAVKTRKAQTGTGQTAADPDTLADTPPAPDDTAPDDTAGDDTPPTGSAGR